MPRRPLTRWWAGAGAFGDKAGAQRRKQHDIHSAIRPTITSRTSQHYAEALGQAVIGALLVGDTQGELEPGQAAGRTPDPTCQRELSLSWTVSIDSVLMPVVMTSEDAVIRYRLRLARTNVQVLPDDDEERRRNTFWAALQQFEELLDAAGRVGPAARPLPLFYALSQAGRAITAAHGSVPWELRGHGLKLSKDSPRDLLERTVRPEPNRAGDDSFSRVAQTIGSGVLTGPVELGAIWASLPFEIPKPWAHKWHTTLQVKSLIRPTGMAASDLQLMDLEGRSQLLTSEAGALVGEFTVDQLTADSVRQILEQYPTAQGWYFPDSRQCLGVRNPNGWSVVLAWRADGISNDDRLAKLSEVAPEYRYHGHRWLRPAVGTQRDYLEPLSSWWILLYGLSMVARYEPAAWAKVLEINESELAADLESLLDEALLHIPQLVLEALEGQTLLVSQ